MCDVAFEHLSEFQVAVFFCSIVVISNLNLTSSNALHIPSTLDKIIPRPQLPIHDFLFEPGAQTLHVSSAQLIQVKAALGQITCV